MEKLPDAETIGTVSVLLGAVYALWKRLQTLTDRYVKAEGDRNIELQAATAERLGKMDGKIDVLIQAAAELARRQ